ncbi:MAG: FAD-dependent oxidoreductase [Propionibacteriaceae bacterium]|nr:FAD-dependent oxidoreductase [Propionibacteriaceae bacterium]
MEKTKIVIVGGVAGGMSVAARLRRLDQNAEIIVLEQGEHVSFANCGLPYYVGGEIVDEAQLLVQTPQSLRESLNLDVRTHHQVISFDAAAKTVRVSVAGQESELSYDHLVLAPGAVAARPPIPGLDHPLVHTLRDVKDAATLKSMVVSGAKHAVVLGAGFIGLEAAEGLKAQGLNVTLIEMAPHVLPPLEQEMAWLVSQELLELGIDVREGIAATKIEDQNGVAQVSLSDQDVLSADLVVLSVGTRPATAPFAACGLACDEQGAIITDEQGRTNLANVWALGDAVASVDAVTGVSRSVQLAGPANRSGRLVADAIGNTPCARQIPKLFGTAILRVGSLTAAMTGANRASLERAGMEYTTLHLHPLHHAGYFPGASQVHLLVHIEPETGKILGAQGVGGAGVDKRIDVLATAMRAGLTAPDLIDIDLAYSPLYGSAKDPVTMVGFLADNVLTGQTKLWYPTGLDWARKQCLILDVRTPDEFASGHVLEAVNIPHVELRESLAKVVALAAGRPIAVMCQSGVRSYIAHRILASAGLDSQTLSGGMLTLRAYLGANADDAITKSR